MATTFLTPNRGDIIEPRHISQFIAAINALEAGLFPGLNVDSGVLYVDATNNRVGINDTTPSFALDVNGSVAGALLDKGGQVFNVKAYGAVGDGSTDDTAAVQAAIDACGAAGGGEVRFPLSANAYKLASRITVAGNGVRLVGSGMTPQGVGTTHPNLLVAHNSWPAILFGGSSTTYYHMGMRDLSILHSSGATGTASYGGDASYGAMIGVDRCGRIYFENLWMPDSNDSIACGTFDNPVGASGLHIINCNFYFRRFGVAIRGASLLNIDGGEWQDRSPSTGTAVYFFGAADGTATGTITDGGRINNLFVESVGRGIRMNQTNGVVGNLVVSDTFFDGVSIAGLEVSNAAGYVQKVAIVGGRWNGAPAASGYGVIISPSGTGIAKAMSFTGLTLADMGRHGVWQFTPPAADAIHDLDYKALVIKDCSASATNTYSGFRIEDTNTDYRIQNCTITSHSPSDSNRMKYGIDQDGTGHDRFAITGNVTDNMQTGRYAVGTAHSAPDKVWSNPDQPPAYGSATGSTSGPTTNSTNYADLAEMSVTVTTIGGDLEARFDAQITNGTLGASTVLAFSLDGAAEVHERGFNASVANDYSIVSLVHRFASVSAGSHTVKVRWKVGAGTATAQTTRRDLVVREIR